MTGFYDTIKKNNVPLFSRNSNKSVSGTNSKLDIVKDDCSLFSRLFISCQSRQLVLEEFFSHENQSTPPSLSKGVKINIGVKSQLVEILQSKCGLPSEEPQVESIFIDGAAMVNFKPPHKPITFEAYANDVILPYIKNQANKCSRVDIIFDVYLENTFCSLKSQTRKERGTGIQRKVFGSGMTPRSWNNFLRVNENKTELFSFLAERIASLNPSKLVCVTQ